MKRKSLTSLSLILALILLVTACSGQAPVETDAPAAENTPTVSADKQEPEEITDTGSKDPVMEVLMGSDSDYKTPDGFAYFTSTIITTSPLFALGKEDSQKYPKLNEALKEHSLKWKAERESRMDDLEQNVTDDIIAMGFDQYTDDDYEEFYESGSIPAEFKDSLTGRLMRADSTVFSARLEHVFYTGSAIGDECMGLNLDPATGEEIALTDILSDTDSILNMLKEMLAEDVIDQVDDNEEYAAQYFQDHSLNDIPWTIANDRLHFYLNNALDIYCFTEDIPFSDLKGNIKPEYAAGGSEYMVPFAYDNSTWFDNGSEETFIDIYENRNWDSDYEQYTGYTFYSGSGSYDVEEYYYDAIPYLLKQSDDEYYVYIERTEDNDYRSADIFYIGDGSECVHLTTDYFQLGFVENSDFDAYLTCISQDPARLKLYTRTQNLGTADGYRYYLLDKDKVVPETDYYMYDQDLSYKIVYTSLIDFKSDIIGEDGNVIEKDALIPAGTEFSFYRGIEGEYMDFALSDGRIAHVVTYMDDDFNHYINDVNAEDVFGMLYFAG